MSAMEMEPTQPWRARRSRVLAALLLVLAMVGAWALFAPRGAAKPAPAAAVQAPLEFAAADVATVELRPLARRLPISGTLMPLVQTTLKAQVAGQVLEVTVREGQSVQRGEVLVRIDTRNLEAQLDAQQAALDKARADLALAKLNRDNGAAMLREHFISQNAYDTLESTYQADLANVRAAEAQLRLAQLNRDYATVRAPFDGRVASRMVEPGEQVSVDSGLLGLVDLSHMELQAPVPAQEIPQVHPGQIVRFRVGGFGERRFEGRVQRINPVTDPGSRFISVYVAVDNADGALRGGMFAQGELILDATAPVAAVPASAVRNEAGIPYVYVLADGRLHKRTVTMGERSRFGDDSGPSPAAANVRPEKDEPAAAGEASVAPGTGGTESDWVEIRSGLKPGERVVIARGVELQDGAAAVLHSSAAATE